MKRIAVTFLVCFALLFPNGSPAQSMSPTDQSEPPATGLEEPAVGQVKSTMDGLTLLMGVYSPFHSEMKGIYGGMFSISGQYCLSMDDATDLLASIGYIRKSGDPYYNAPTFSSGGSSTICIVPMELSVRRRMVFVRSPSGYVSRGFYVGAGINYIRATEDVPKSISASGGDFGIQMFAGPQMFLAENLAFEGEVKLLLNNVDMEYEDNRYSLTLSGLIIRAALSWYY